MPIVVIWDRAELMTVGRELSVSSGSINLFGFDVEELHVIVTKPQ